MERLRAFREHDIHVLGSFIFGLPSDDRDTFDATVALAEQANLTFAQFVLLTPFPGTVDFEKWAAHEDNRERQVHGVPITRHWRIPKHQRPKLYSPHPVMSLEDIRGGTQRTPQWATSSPSGERLTWERRGDREHSFSTCSLSPETNPICRPVSLKLSLPAPKTSLSEPTAAKSRDRGSDWKREDLRGKTTMAEILTGV